MSRYTLFIAAAVLALACSWAEAGKATATVGISARVDAFAEWRAGETRAAVTTATGGRSVRIAKTLTLFANTDVTLTLAPHLNAGVLTAADGGYAHGRRRACRVSWACPPRGHLPRPSCARPRRIRRNARRSRDAPGGNGHAISHVRHQRATRKAALSTG